MASAQTKRSKRNHIDEPQSASISDLLKDRIRAAVGEWPEMPKGAQFLHIRLSYVHGHSDRRFVIPVPYESCGHFLYRLPELQSGRTFHNDGGRFDIWTNEPLSAEVVLTRNPQEILGRLEIGCRSLGSHVEIAKEPIDMEWLRTTFEEEGTSFRLIERIIHRSLLMGIEVMNTSDATITTPEQKP